MENKIDQKKEAEKIFCNNCKTEMNKNSDPHIDIFVCTNNRCKFFGIGLTREEN